MCNLQRERENIEPVTSAGKHREAAVRAGKFMELNLCKHCKVRNQLKLKHLPNAGSGCAREIMKYGTCLEGSDLFLESPVNFGPETPLVKLQFANTFRTFRHRPQVPCYKCGEACKKSCDLEKRWKSCIYGCKRLTTLRQGWS